MEELPLSPYMEISTAKLEIGEEGSLSRKLSAEYSEGKLLTKRAASRC